jgi:membrane-associated protein
VSDLIDVVLHIDRYLAAWTASYGTWVYVILTAIVFCETGLVIAPFLPGDSLLFAAGAVAAVEGAALDPALLIALLSGAAIAGDAVNYAVGRRLGPRVFSGDSKLLNREHVRRAHDFYEKYGGRAIVFARFVPIIRTFAPFVAGMGSMQYRRFALFNVSGGIVWVASFTLLGYWFGSIPAVGRNFHIVVLAIIAVSLIPLVVAWWRSRRGAR